MKKASRLLFLLLSLVAVHSLFAQQQPAASETVHVTAIEVTADVRDRAGKVPANLTPADFTLLEDGVARKIVAVDYLRAPEKPGMTKGPSSRRSDWQTVLYFETQMTHAQSRKRVAEELAKQAETLVGLGPVDVILANPAPTPIIRQTRDAAELREALKKVGSTPGSNQLYSHRRNFLINTAQLNVLGDLRTAQNPVAAMHQPQPMEYGKPNPTQNANSMTTGGASRDYYRKDIDADMVKPHISEELMIIRRFRDNLTGWLGSYRRMQRRALVLVTNGFDLEPLDFYARTLSKGDQLSLRGYIQQSGAGVPTDHFVQTVAGAGWTVFTFPGDTTPERWLDDASVSGAGRMNMQNNSPNTSDPAAKAVFIRPFDPLQMAADQSGGALVVNNAKLVETLEKLNDRVIVTYQVDRKADTARRKIQLTHRDPEVKVNAAKWASSTAPQEIAEARALRLLTTEVPGSDLTLNSSATWTAATDKRRGNLQASADVKAIAALLPAGSKGDFRISFAIRVPPNGAVVRSVMLNGYDISSGQFQIKSPIDIPANASQIVMTVEEVNTGMWGSSNIPLE